MVFEIRINRFSIEKETVFLQLPIVNKLFTDGFLKSIYVLVCKLCFNASVLQN